MGGKRLRKSVLVGVPLRAVPVDRKLSKTKKKSRHSRIVCFEEESSGTEATTPRNCLGSIPGEYNLCSSKISTTEKRSQGKIDSFRRVNYRK
jgi:hypothetical protein